MKIKVLISKTAENCFPIPKFSMNKANTNVILYLQISLESEKYLFSLKEILVQESNTHLEFIQNIFWGLLACQLA